MEKITPQHGWLLQQDRAVAWLRVAFALVAVTVIPLNPSRKARSQTLSLFSLGSFFVCSLAILKFTRWKKFASEGIRLVTARFDLIWITLGIFWHALGTTDGVFSYVERLLSLKLYVSHRQCLLSLNERIAEPELYNCPPHEGNAAIIGNTSRPNELRCL